jgi:hypothetical protein
VREHKDAFRRYLAGLVADAGYPDDVADAVYLLAEGATVTAGIDPGTSAAAKARRTVAQLLRARAGAADLPADQRGLVDALRGPSLRVVG